MGRSATENKLISIRKEMGKLNDLMTAINELDVHEDPLCTSLDGRQTLKQAQWYVSNIYINNAE